MEEDAGVDVEEDATIETPKVQDARLLKEIFEEVIFPRWKALVATKDEEEARPCALERFHCGWLLLSPYLWEAKH
jgi:fanconi-associated nuclease 1